MFLGHFAVGFASKRLAPRASLGILLAAPLLLDLVWPFFGFLGLEKLEIAPGDTAFTPLRFVSYPYTHSLLGSAIWGLAFSLSYWWFRRYLAGAAVIFAGVLSHWILDMISHRPDMPIFLGGPFVGLGLWNSVPATVVVEGALFVCGVALYLPAARGIGLRGRLSVYGMVGLLLVIYAANIFGPPPPSVNAVLGSALLLWIFPAWAWWLDRRRGA